MTVAAGRGCVAINDLQDPVAMRLPCAGRGAVQCQRRGAAPGLCRGGHGQRPAHHCPGRVHPASGGALRPLGLPSHSWHSQPSRPPACKASRFHAACSQPPIGWATPGMREGAAHLTAWCAWCRARALQAGWRAHSPPTVTAS